MNLKVQLHYKHKGQDARRPASWSRSGPSSSCWKTTATASPCRSPASRRCRSSNCRCGSTCVGATTKQPDKVTLGMAYLRKGITWIPDYTLKVLDDETAELTLRGTLVNEAEDLIHTDVHLVVACRTSCTPSTWPRSPSAR